MQALSPASPLSSLSPITPHTNPRLSKSRIMSGLQCHKRLWLETYRRELMAYGEASQAAFAQGNVFGELARELIAHVHGEAGHLLENVENPAQALSDTLAAMPQHALLFEPAFRFEGVFVRLDALIRIDRGDDEPCYTMVEVKASASVKPQYVRDVAIQTWVLRGCGLHVNRIELGHVDTSFVYQGDSYNGLLKRVDITAQVEEQLPLVDAWVSTLRQMLRSADTPDIATGRHCTTPYPCPFVSHCQSHAAAPNEPAPQHSVFMIPGIKGKAFARKLQAKGYEDLLAVPLDLMGEYAFVQAAHRDHTAWHDAPVASTLLNAQPQPWGYLDFETISPAVPLWAGTQPFAHWPFQWSVHMSQADGSTVHSDFLDVSGGNPAVACAEQLLGALSGARTVWAYNAAFERQVIMRLARAVPSHSEALTVLAGIVQDLIPIVQASYYHPVMQGSYSIKSVLPAIAPELSYHDLQGVQDGNAAQGAFFEAVSPDCTAERKAQLNQQLRDYCKLDTWAMVVLVKRLLQADAEL